MQAQAAKRLKKAADAVCIVRDAGGLGALSHPMRVQILERLREPKSAAAVARVLGEARQKVNYHLKELETAGLIELVGEARVGNFVESLYRAVARTFLISPEVTWGDPRRAKALAQQHSLQTMVDLGERLQRDAALLIERAAFSGEEIASASVMAEARFADEARREAFLNDYLRATSDLLAKHGAKHGAPYRVVLGVYPEPEGGEQ